MLYYLLLGLLSTTQACTNKPWGQCGGNNFAGTTCCPSGFACGIQNEWFHQCMPAISPPAPPPPACGLVSECDTKHVVGGASWQICVEAKTIQCCLDGGDAKSTCCTNASFPVIRNAVHHTEGYQVCSSCKIVGTNPDGTMKTAGCDETAAPNAAPTTAPSPAPACDTSYCNGAGGASATYCHSAKMIECCIRDTGNQTACCEGASPYMFDGSPGLEPCKAIAPPPPPSPPPPSSPSSCALVSECDTKHVVGGAAHRVCVEAKTIQCCLDGGDDKTTCCARATMPVIQLVMRDTEGYQVCSSCRVVGSNPDGSMKTEGCDETAAPTAAPTSQPTAAPTTPPCDLSACDGCSGVQCTACREPLKAACCIRDGGDKATCCAHGYAQVSNVCKASPPPSPPPPTTSPNCAKLAGRGDAQEVHGKWCFQLNGNTVEGGCGAYYTQSGKGHRLCTAPAPGSKRCGSTDLFQCEAAPPPSPSPPSPAVPPQCAELQKRDDLKAEKNKWCPQLKLEDAGDGGCEAWSTTTRKGSRLCLPPKGDGNRCRVTELFTCPASTPMARGVNVELMAEDDEDSEEDDATLTGASVLAPGIGVSFLALGAVAFGVRRARRVNAASPSGAAKASGAENCAETSLVAVAVVGHKRPNPPPDDGPALGGAKAVTVRRLSAAATAGARRLSAYGRAKREVLEELSVPIAPPNDSAAPSSQ